MAELIDRASEDPDAALDYGCSLPDVGRLFGGAEGLLLSLEQRWVTFLTAKLDQAAYEGVPPERAAAELATEQPGLRSLLDAAARRSDRVRSQERDDEWIIKVYGSATGTGMAAVGLPRVRNPAGVADPAWSQQHQRMAIIADLIDRASGNPDAALDYGCSLPDVGRLFGGAEGLLLSLEQRWVTLLTAKLDQAAYEGVPSERAAAELAIEQPGLRALLDAAARRSVRMDALEHADEWIVEVFHDAPGHGVAVP
ncbi:hypothetical protein OQ968_15455 [Mycobacterium sp. 663a-19]|uniref:hypothetical protein n=1 Tax=Mycobacterium sp. 663a-19 TaxID=2986148 RepID=UPI002D1F2D12|nr:hypothetical protein [Mycobacterium sp. 663a-19]MEB3982657.1 hypothetical protein [Mycobacterium sp. 663a-19]